MGLFDRFKNSSDSKNFKYLDKLIHSGVKEIVLDSDIVLGRREEKKYLGGIELDVDDLIIDRNGHSVDAMGGSRIFNCTGQRITLKNIILKNGFAKNGGAICSKCEDLNIVECEIIQNSAGENGGGIYNFNGNITITKSTISNNRAVNGGAIYNWSEIYENAKMTIHDSTLSKNKVEFRGGAIFNLCTMNVSSSTFSDNVALSDGGAILNESNLATSTISGSTFCKNRSFTGGAISNDQGGMMIVSDSILSDNTAWMEGVIYNLEGALRLIKCEVSNNKSWCEKRPTLMDQNSIILNNDYFESNSSIFRDNESKVILKNNSNASLSIIHGEFIDNKSDYVIVNDGNFCLIERILFENNACLDTLVNHTNLTLRNPKISCNGKTILNEGHLMISEEPSTLLNQIHGEGKIEFPQFPNDENFNFCHLDKKIHQSNVREIVLDEDICFGNYETDYYEGGIELDIDNLTIDGNGHTIDGAGKSRIFIVTAKNVTLKNIIFRNGRSHKSYYNPFNSSGGAIRVNFNASLTVENCRFESNISEENGGAICNGGEVNISDSTLSQNTVKNTYNSKFNSEFFALSENAWTGGAICNWGVMNISGSALFENTAGIGGAIINWGVVNIFDSNLFKNTGDRYAGAIQNWAGKLTIYDSTLSKNTVNSMGGAIQNWGGKVAVYSSILSENTAGFGGGAIANRGELTITESTLQENTAQEDGGGAILNEWGGLLIISSTIIDSLFTGNKAARNGGAIYNDRGELSITESTITENTAESRGGAIYIYESKYESENCTFKDNKPDDVYEEKD